MAINPLQIPGYAAPQAIDFSSLGNLPQVYQKARMESARQQTLAELGQGSGPLDYDNAARKLLAVGDREGAMSLAQLGSNNRDFQFRQQEAARQQGNTDRSFDLQKRTADEAARGFDYKEIDDGNGGKQLVQINKATGEVVKPVVPGGVQPNNPFAYGKQNENQSKDSGFANRMFRAEGILRDPAVEQAATSIYQNAVGKAPLAGNFMTSPAFQKYDQAKRDFVNAVLRRESGAAISQSEFDNAEKQYFPQPGDSKERLAEKRRNRQDSIAGVAGGGGQTYKPPFTFGENGEMVPTGNRQGAPKMMQPAPAQAGGAKQIASKAEFDALPSGSTFTAPDGSVRIKP